MGCVALHELEATTEFWRDERGSDEAGCFRHAIACEQARTHIQAATHRTRVELVPRQEDALVSGQAALGVRQDIGAPFFHREEVLHHAV